MVVPSVSPVVLVTGSPVATSNGKMGLRALAQRGFARALLRFGRHRGPEDLQPPLSVYRRWILATPQWRLARRPCQSTWQAARSKRCQRCTDMSPARQHEHSAERGRPACELLLTCTCRPTAQRRRELADQVGVNKLASIVYGVSPCCPGRGRRDDPRSV